MIDSGSEVLAANLRVLARRSSELADALASAAAKVGGSSPLPTPVRARSGALSAAVGSSWLHSRYDPEAEARNAVAALGSDELIVLFGLGLGYAARAALARGHRVAVIESDAGWLASLLGLVDLEDILGDERLDLILCPGGAGFLDYLEARAPRSMARIENGATMAAFPEAAESLRSQLARFRQRDEVNAATLARFGRLWVRNIARNARPASALPGLGALRGAFGGLPAVVLAAGPSLDELLPSLADIADRAVVVCVDTALRSALAAGIQPDFVVIVDPQYWNARHLDRCLSPRSVLVAEAAVWPAVLRFGAERTVLCSSIYPLGRNLETGLGIDRGSLGAGGSVATTAWDLARIMGCSPIFMAGLDLSFPGARTHARASLFEQRALAGGSRLKPASNEAFLAMLGGRPFRSRANDEGEVVTDERLALYASWFTRRLAVHREAPTFNLSRRGLAIEGMTYLDWREILASPRIRDGIGVALRRAVAAMDVERLPPPGDVERALGALTAELEGLAGLADKAVALAEEAKALEEPALSSALEELDRIDAEVLRSGVKDVAGFLVASAAESVKEPARTVGQSLDRTIAIYRSVAESARYHAFHCAYRPGDS